MLIDIHPRNSKPLAGSVQIDGSHPLSRGLLAYLLFSEGGGIPVDLTNGGRKVTSKATWRTSARGVSTRYDGTTSASFPIDLSGTDKVTIIVSALWDSFANDDKLLGEYTPDTNTNKGLFIDPNSSAPGIGTFKLAMGQGATGARASTFTRPTAGVFHSYVFLFDRALDPGMTAYVDSVAQAMTVVLTATITGTFANDTIFLMSRNNTSLFGVGNLLYWGIYNRILSASDAVWLHQEPYTFLRPVPAMRFWSIPPTVTGGTHLLYLGRAA